MKLTLLVVLLFPMLAISQESLLPAKEDFHLFLLVGQSNMAGRGVVTPPDQEPIPRVLMLNQQGKWVPAVDPMHFDKPSAGVGLGRTFGLEISKARPGVTIGLIPCAVGGSPIDTWLPGAFDPATKTHPWDDAMKRTHAALEMGTLKGILWHQGEADCKPDLAPGYTTKLHDLVTRFREELKTPDVPFIAGQMGKFSDNPWTPEVMTVDRVHQDLPKYVKSTAFVSAEGLKHKGDKIHFDADSYRELGRRYAATFLKMAP
ncbi:MAG: sialate O-acetylesterase [Verrucomicrobiales bacterium]|nr:sialate O-acetylesterase [Verrucomicrobiales bacterium]